MKMSGALSHFIAHVVPGLEELAATHLTGTLPGFEVTSVLRRFDERTSLLLFRYPGPPGDLLSLRMTEDIFALAVDVAQIRSDRRGLASIRRLLQVDPGLEHAVALATEVRRGKGRLTYRVVTRVAGRQAFRRVDLQRAVETALGERFPRWRLVDDNARLEVWTQLVRDRFIAGVRLSDVTMRQRSKRVASLPAALKPTIAYAMVALSEPRPDDVFLDPMCGSGTLLLERAEAGRYRLLLGGDIDPEAVRATRENVGRRYKPIEVYRWDARNLPLDNASVSVIACNLPFGKQIGTRDEVRGLYPQLLTEWLRVLAPGGRMVLLTSQRDALELALRAEPMIRVSRRLRVLVRGVPATIFVTRTAPVARASVSGLSDHRGDSSAVGEGAKTRIRDAPGGRALRGRRR